MEFPCIWRQSWTSISTRNQMKLHVWCLKICLLDSWMFGSFYLKWVSVCICFAYIFLGCFQFWFVDSFGEFLLPFPSIVVSKSKYKKTIFRNDIERAGGNSKKKLFSPLFGEDEPILIYIFQMGWVETTNSWSRTSFMKDHRWWDDCGVLTLQTPWDVRWTAVLLEVQPFLNGWKWWEVSLTPFFHGKDWFIMPLKFNHFQGEWYISQVPGIFYLKLFKPFLLEMGSFLP